ncbi:MAG: pyrrolo-quinoline quinone [Phycisphaerales bacterium]|nr:pyrrolo-quinoline quinone [Phycisphaerales bacterium]
MSHPLFRVGKRRQKLALDRAVPARKVRTIAERLENRTLMSTSVLTYHNDLGSTGLNSTETTLTPANVSNTNFYQKFYTHLDGQVYAQPLYVPNLAVTFGGTTSVHNVAFVVTENDSLYWIDSGTGAILHQDALGGGTGVTPGQNPDLWIPSEKSGSTYPIGGANGTVGITGTPTIDAATNTLYLVTTTEETISSVVHFRHRLHAIDIQTGTDVNTIIGDSTNAHLQPGTSGTYVSGPFVYKSDHVSKTQFFDGVQLQRSALTLANNSVEVPFSSYGDGGNAYYHGWVLGYATNNIVANPGFESGSLAPSWSDPFNGSTVVTGNAHSGTYAVQVATGGETLQTLTGLQPNTTYTASAWVKVAAGEQVTLGAKNYDSMGSAVSLAVFSSTYTQASVTFTTGASNTTAILFLHKVVGTGVAYGDDFKVITLAPTAVFCDTPNGVQGGIWMSGGKVDADASGNLYLQTGNGSFDTSTPPNTLPADANYGDTSLKLSPDSSTQTNQNPNGWGLKVADYFTPSNENDLNVNDRDLGSGGQILVDQGSNHLVIGAGKEGIIDSVNRAAMGGFYTAGQWKFDSTVIHQGDPATYTPDASGNGFDAKFFGGATIVTANAKYTGSLSLDGTGFADIQTHNPNGNGKDYLNQAGPITLSAWIRPTAWSVTSTENIIAHGYTIGQVNEVVLNLQPHGVLAVSATKYDPMTGTSSSTGTTYTFPTLPANGTWEYVTGTFDGTNWNLYLNGNLVSSTAGPFGAVPMGSDWFVGASAQSNDRRYFTGLIDDARIYERNLSQSQIASIMSAQSLHDSSFTYPYVDYAANVAQEQSSPQTPSNFSALYGTPAYFNNTLYYGWYHQEATAYPISNGAINFSSPTVTTDLADAGQNYSGSTPSISASGSTNGIVWHLNRDQRNGNQGTIQAYNASNYSELCKVAIVDPSTDPNVMNYQAPVLAQFQVPTIADGMLFVGLNQLTTGGADSGAFAGYTVH